jgi:hypothetical protein
LFHVISFPITSRDDLFPASDLRAGWMQENRISNLLW